MNGISNREDDTSNLEKLEIQPVKLGLPELKEIGAKWLVDMATYISNNPWMDSFFGFALLWNARIKGTLGGLLEVDRQYLLPVTVQWMIPPLHRKSEHTHDTFVGKLSAYPILFHCNSIPVCGIPRFPITDENLFIYIHGSRKCSKLFWLYCPSSFLDMLM